MEKSFITSGSTWLSEYHVRNNIYKKVESFCIAHAAKEQSEQGLYIISANVPGLL